VRIDIRLAGGVEFLEVFGLGLEVARRAGRKGAWRRPYGSRRRTG
jgi:hypothetical protein